MPGIPRHGAFHLDHLALQPTITTTVIDILACQPSDRYRVTVSGRHSPLPSSEENKIDDDSPKHAAECDRHDHRTLDRPAAGSLNRFSLARIPQVPLLFAVLLHG